MIAVPAAMLVWEFSRGNTDFGFPLPTSRAMPPACPANIMNSGRTSKRAPSAVHPADMFDRFLSSGMPATTLLYGFPQSASSRWARPQLNL